MLTLTAENWKIGATLSVLDKIHNDDTNITIHSRDIGFLREEIDRFLEQEINIQTSGNEQRILDDVSKVLSSQEFSLIVQDIRNLLNQFKLISRKQEFQVFLATVNTNMCRRFHTDRNDLRMLCTYSGPGTLWLKNENMNRTAQESFGDNEAIVYDKKEIQHAKTGDTVILKGTLYPQEKKNAVVHRSPTIEESGNKRLLLRIDTN